METLLEKQTFNLTQFEEKIFEKKPSGDVMVFMLLPVENSFYKKEIYGKKIIDWVKMSASGYPVNELAYLEGKPVEEFIKPYLTSHPTTVVLFADTPLFTKKMLDKMLSYFSFKQMKVLSTRRAYIFDTHYLKTSDYIESGENSLFNWEEFLAVSSPKTLADTADKIHKQIVNFHMIKGVEILDPKTTFIDCDVVIEKGVRIEPQNVLKGETVVCENVWLKEGNVVENGVLEEGCVLSHCHVINARIKQFTKHTFEKLGN